MPSLINRISTFIFPNTIYILIRPYWHRTQLFFRYITSGGSLWFSWELQCFIGKKKKISNSECSMTVCLQSFRECLRWMQFSLSEPDCFTNWLASLDEKSMLWDIGASNGLEGFYSHTITKCSVVFIEPSTLSVSSILKSIYIQYKKKYFSRLPFEVVQAACSDHSGYERLVMHTKPVPGENYNSLEAGIPDYCQGGRSEMDNKISQWVYCVSLDDLLSKHNLSPPTHLKIDVDGLELMVLRGSEKVLGHHSLRECVIEVNDENPQPVVDLMKKHNFKKCSELIHADQGKIFTADYFFKRDI